MTDKTAVEAMAEGLFKNPNKSHHPSAQAALDALKANGFAVVPVKATPEMVQAGWLAWRDIWGGGNRVRREILLNAWRAMIAEA